MCNVLPGETEHIVDFTSQLKTELLSQWKLEAEFRSTMKIIINFVDTSSFSKMSQARMKLGHARMTHIPRSMMKIIINFVDTSSFSTVTSSCQKTSLTRMKLGHARMTHIP